MKILRVVSDLYPSVVGGVGLHAHEMSRLQAQEGHDVTVLTYGDGSGQPSYEDRDGYNITKEKVDDEPNYYIFTDIELSPNEIVSI